MICSCRRKDELAPIFGRGAPSFNEKSETHKKNHIKKTHKKNSLRNLGGVMVLKPG